MSINEILLKIASATPQQLARVSSALSDAGESPDVDIRTVTKTEAGKRLGVSRSTIWRMMRDGKLEGVRLNGVDRVRLLSLVQYVNGMPVRRCRVADRSH